MIRWPIIILLLAGLATGEGEKKGREGNRQYRDGQYEKASELYRAGIESDGEQAGPIASRLFNNLGASLFRLEQLGDAETSFSRSIALATENGDLTRAAYNAGNAAVGLEKLEESLAYYRQALLADPGNADARFNYEFVKRQLESQQNQQQSQPDSSDEQNQDSSGGQNDEQQDDQNQNQDQSDQPEDQEQQQQEQQQQESQMSRDQAEQILRAMENDEKQLLQQVRKRPSRRTTIEKDW